MADARVSDLAPVIVFAYNRPAHLQRALEALNANELADETDVFLFIDGPKDDKDREVQGRIRWLLSNTSYRFKKFEVSHGGRNRGLARSIIEGVTKVIEAYGKAIVLEDDLVTSRRFLTFMNTALTIYMNVPKVWSISGYSFNVNIPPGYPYSTYFSPRGSSLGWGTWHDRWVLTDWDLQESGKFFADKRRVKAFNGGGEDLTEMLRAQVEGRPYLDSWAIRWCFSQYENRALTLCPVASRLTNIGDDGSGTHSHGRRRPAEIAQTAECASDPEDTYPTSVACDDFILRSLQSQFTKYRHKLVILRMIDDLGLFGLFKAVRRLANG